MEPDGGKSLLDVLVNKKEWRLEIQFVVTPPNLADIPASNIIVRCVSKEE
jgi:hypothetical protein